MLLKIAGVTADVQNAHPLLCRYCADYVVSDGEPDMKTVLPDIPPAQQSVELCRAFSTALLRRGGFLLHASALAKDGEAFLFTAHSGTGKSTHAQMWREVFGEGVVPVNDDKPAIIRENGLFFVCGTPWAGKHSLQNNICVPLRAAAFLRRGEKDCIEKMPSEQIVSEIFDQVPRPDAPADMEVLLSLLDRFISETPFFELRCTPTHNAALTAYAAMKGASL